MRGTTLQIASEFMACARLVVVRAFVSHAFAVLLQSFLHKWNILNFHMKFHAVFGLRVCSSL